VLRQRFRLVLTIGRHLGDPDHDAPMVVDLERRAERRIVQLGELGIPHHDEGVVGVDVLDAPGEETWPPEEAGVVDPDDGDRLVRPRLLGLDP
jgi:hypothetical protein